MSDPLVGQENVPKREPPAIKKKRSFKKGLMIFAVAVLALIGASTILSSFLPEEWKSDRQKIGLVEVTGIITDATDVIQQLSDFRKDKSIKGIILRIDSPGGVVAPAQEIYDEILKIKKSRKKIYASMGTLAASGGYYIASPVDLIVANPGTLTGSIGVIMTFVNPGELLEKIGVHPEIVKKGEFKDIGQSFRPLSKKERQVLQGVVDDVYQQFVEAVAQGRGLEISQVEQLADGRIYSGRQAYELKLVDHLGGLEETISLLSKALGIEGEPQIVQKKASKGLLSMVLEGSVPKRFIDSITLSPAPTLQYLWTLP